ncbi:MAG: PIG-L deacetylase family protein [Flavisolibacter sp.]
MLNTKNIFVLAPHTDDGEWGCGASIAKYIAEGKMVTYVAFSTCAQSLPSNLPTDTLLNECKEATHALGIRDLRFFDFQVRYFPSVRQEILEALVKLNDEYHPDTVLLPAQNDKHQDHRVIFAEGCRAFKNSNILGYELPWNNTRFQPTYFETVTEDHLAAKQDALKKYKSQMHRKYMNDELVRSVAKLRGIQCGADLAEAFEIYTLRGI